MSSFLTLVRGAICPPPEAYGGWNDKRYWGAIVKREAAKYEVDPVSIAALILHESKEGLADSQRWERAFYDKYIAGQSQAALGGYWPRYARGGGLGEMVERLSRANSYGHGQIMGQVARELGFRGEYFIELCDPEINIPLTCRHFKNKETLAIKHNEGAKPEKILWETLLNYNGRGNPDYPPLVIKFIDSGEAEAVVI